MQKISKKLISILTAIILVVSLVPNVASAAKVGDVIGHAYYTDIVATINGYQLQSYNVNGSTYIVAEDLRYYGFDVVFDLPSKILSVRRNPTITWINPQAYNSKFWNIGADKNKKNIVHSDIVTYVNDYYAPSYNIDGCTIINFNELGRFGTVKYDNNRREISLVMSGANYNPVAKLAEELQGQVYNMFNSDWRYIYRAKGDVLMLYCISSGPIKWTTEQYNNYINVIIPMEKEDDKDMLEFCKNRGYPVSSIYVEYLEYDNTYITSYQLY